MVKLIKKEDSVLNGITGFVELWDFSEANTSYESRVNAVTQVASICYQNPKALGSVSLFDRLQAESGGLPSSSYEFVPVLLTYKQDFGSGELMLSGFEHCYKYGEELNIVHPNNKGCNRYTYVLTNLRALIEDVGPDKSLNYLNTDPAELQIIRDNFKVFLFNVDLSTRAQMVRHRVSWQELSRRYVSGKKKEFEFYISTKMSGIISTDTATGVNCEITNEYDSAGITEICLNHYNAAIDSGVKPEEARRILPQAMMTQIWGVFQPNQLTGFFKLRLDKHAQLEIRCVAEAMQRLLNES